MKHIIYVPTSFRLALFLCLFAGKAQAQYAPFVGANTILLSTFLADKQAHAAVSAVLTQQSLSFTGAENRLLIRSQSKSTFAASGLVFLGQLKINAGVVELTGRLMEVPTDETLPSSTQGTPILFAKSRNSAQWLAFSYMDALAKQLQSALKASIMYKYQVNTL
ncbi:hypothetical protein GCM10028807_41310 [Spirosoma daeguense]